MSRRPTPEYKKYYVARVEGRGRNKDYALEMHGVDLAYILSWIRGDVKEQTEVEVYEGFAPGEWVATSTVTFERKENKVYRR